MIGFCRDYRADQTRFDRYPPARFTLTIGDIVQLATILRAKEQGAGNVKPAKV